MSELSELYQQMIIDHYRRPRNYHKLATANREAEGHNPLCGDQIHLYLQVEGDRIADVGFEGQGCAISKASASVMTDAVKGLTREEARILFTRFHDLVTGKAAPDAEYGKLAVFSGVSQYPARVKCASLAWHTLKAALEKEHATVSTE